VGLSAAVIWQLMRGQSRAPGLAERLNAFYAPQANAYDQSREQLLHGRQALVDALALKPGERFVELGAGTGKSLDYLYPTLATLEQVTLVDLCPALLNQAKRRAAGHANVQIIEADVTTWCPAQPADVVLFSYALTMIPDWFKAIDAAFNMLRPGGRIGVVDFYVSRRCAEPGARQHSVLTRAFWPLWFGHDGVHPSADHLPYLRNVFQPMLVHEHMAHTAWLFGSGVPWYQFIGQKEDGTHD